MVRCCGKRQSASQRQVTRSSGFVRRPGPTTSGKQWRATLTSVSSVSEYRASAAPDVRAEVNRYLLYELQITSGEGESKVSERWPFQLRKITGMAQEGLPRVFEFRHGGEDYFVTSSTSFSLWAKGDMSREDLQRHLLGERWLAKQDAVDLDTAKHGDPRVPPVYERRRVMLEMARKFRGEDKGLLVLEGLFIPAQSRYLALIEDLDSGYAQLIGNGLVPHHVAHPEAAPWRRLAIAVGEKLQSGELGEGR